ncbi:hypothetical protein K9L27_00165 [Candidatus Gracilibacteria bacterium]|nr:hypothetical protein [Candidatus Gracilibacteria bacterium]
MPKRTLEKECYYHIYNRGYNQQQLFFENRDYEKFQNNISRYQEKFSSIRIPVWCILPNHFHFLVFECDPGFRTSLNLESNTETDPGFKKIQNPGSHSGVQASQDLGLNTKTEPGFKGVRNPGSHSIPGLESSSESNISSFLNNLQQSYAAFFNAKYGKTIKKGLKSPVFEGRFQAREITDEAYLSWLKTYIEYNPVKHELVDTSEQWEHSSYGGDPEFGTSLNPGSNTRVKITQNLDSNTETTLGFRTSSNPRSKTRIQVSQNMGSKIKTDSTKTNPGFREIQNPGLNTYEESRSDFDPYFD